MAEVRIGLSFTAAGTSPAKKENASATAGAGAALDADAAAAAGALLAGAEVSTCRGALAEAWPLSSDRVAAFAESPQPDAAAKRATHPVIPIDRTVLMVECPFASQDLSVSVSQGRTTPPSVAAIFERP
jgi:hypothetical protein